MAREALHRARPLGEEDGRLGFNEMLQRQRVAAYATERTV